MSFAIYAMDGEGRSSDNLDGMCSAKDDVVKINADWASEVRTNSDRPAGWSLLNVSTDRLNFCDVYLD